MTSIATGDSSLFYGDAHEQSRAVIIQFQNMPATVEEEAILCQYPNRMQPLEPIKLNLARVSVQQPTILQKLEFLIVLQLTWNGGSDHGE
jgi:hypothetical protein